MKSGSAVEDQRNRETGRKCNSPTANCSRFHHRLSRSDL